MQEHAQLHYLASEAEEIKAVWEWEGVGTWGGGAYFLRFCIFTETAFKSNYTLKTI